jgi:hypothetical protein
MKVFIDKPGIDSILKQGILLSLRLMVNPII